MTPHATVRHVEIIRAAARRKGLDLPDELDEALEARLLARLQPWYARLQANRDRYRAGELERRTAYAKERSTAYDATPFEDDERDAAYALYTTLVRYVAGQVLYWYTRYEDRIRVITLEDGLADSIEIFYRSLAAYDTSEGLRLVSWLYLDLRTLLREYMEEHAAREQIIEDTDEPEAATGDLEGILSDLLDFDTWAERICKGDKELLLVWEYLSMEDETPA